MRKLLLLFAILISASVPVLAAEPALQVADPYVRAVPPGQPNTAVFMTLTNPGTAELAVVSAASPAAEVVELHTHQMVDGMMQMRQIERITVPAGAKTALEPGGLHVMLIGLTQPLAADAVVPVTLTLDDGSVIAIEAPVRAPAAGGMPDQSHHGH